AEDTGSIPVTRSYEFTPHLLGSSALLYLPLNLCLYNSCLKGAGFTILDLRLNQKNYIFYTFELTK
ncbi:hypothetical protein L6307_02790, partial [Candidatus Parcubacteria bacterium]|nr:hypothetical protein [Candidatus Parcubacteria bacterium]